MNVLALCAGAGGLELGLKLAEPAARLVCAVEGEAYVASLLVAHMAAGRLDAAPVWADVRTFDGKPWRGTVDCLTAGYPCQPFSIAGRKRADADPRHLWPHIARIISECQPRRCFFENVAHHLSLGFEQVCHDLESLGYRVAAGLFSAEEVGAPHRRERLFILAQLGNTKHHGSPATTQPSSHAEADGQRWPARGAHPPQQPAGTDSVANSAGAGTGQHQPGARQGTGGNSQSLADPAQPGLEGQRGQPSGTPNFGGGYGFPLWPPSPDDRHAWETVPLTFKPAVHGMADGLAHRVDRIRACGNGVVPLVAAYAWATLRACFDS